MDKDESTKLDIYVHSDADSTKIDRILQLTETIVAALKVIDEQGEKLMAEMDDLTAEVNRSTTVDGGIVTLLNGIAAQLVAAQGNPAKIAALAASLRSNNDAIAAAVTANTPAGSPPVGSP